MALRIPSLFLPSVSCSNNEGMSSSDVKKEKKEKKSVTINEDPLVKAKKKERSAGSNSNSPTRPAVAEVPVQGAADDEWVEGFSETHQKKYWKNKKTGEKSWKNPAKTSEKKTPATAVAVSESPSPVAVASVAVASWRGNNWLVITLFRQPLFL